MRYFVFQNGPQDLQPRLPGQLFYLCLHLRPHLSQWQRYPHQQLVSSPRSPTVGVAIDSQIFNLYFRLYFRPSILLSHRPMPHHPFHKTTRRILHSKHIRALHVLQRPPLHPLQLRIS